MDLLSLQRTRAIRTPPPAARPQINGPRIVGVRPDSPFQYYIPVTGVRPIVLEVSELPSGLHFNPKTATIQGRTSEPGHHKVVITGRNVEGQHTRELTIVVGDGLALTPTMGWSSWNCFNAKIDQELILNQAQAMVTTGLIDHGWTYINIDDGWQGGRDADGRIQGGANFPDLRALGDAIHGLGLKFGIYSSPGPKTCAGFEGSFRHEAQDAQSYAEWGVDFLKHDWCTAQILARVRRLGGYTALLPDRERAEVAALGVEIDTLKAAGISDQDSEFKNLLERRLAIVLKQTTASERLPIDLAIEQAPYRLMGEALRRQGRDIVYNLCNYGQWNVWQWGPQVHAHSWRTTGDILDSWESVEKIGFSQNGLEVWSAPGRWNDPDMLEIGNQNLTPDECFTHMTLWCILAAPLLIGCDLTSMDAFTLSVFSNDEVLAINQDPLGRQGNRVFLRGQIEVWREPLMDGMTAIAVFNRGEEVANVDIAWADLHLSDQVSIRDCWRQRDLPQLAAGLKTRVQAHSAELFRVGKS